MTEVRFNRLVLVRTLPERTKDKHILALWRCDCGIEIKVAASRVRNGYTKSCGCLAREISASVNTKHGQRGSREYSSWQAMKARCLDPENKDYPRWGGKGVTVCPQWAESFEAFFRDLGPRPPGTSLDRIDNNRGYEPGNCRWATPKEQQRNRSTSFRWHIKGLVFETHEEAARHFNVSDHTVWRWVNGEDDKRRNSSTPPREDCYVVRRY